MAEKDIPALVSAFLKDTSKHSSMVSVSHYASVQDLIAAGTPVVEYVFRNNIKLSEHFMNALEEITGENPVKAEHAGLIHEMREDWNAWAIQHNYR